MRGGCWILFLCCLVAGDALPVMWLYLPPTGSGVRLKVMKGFFRAAAAGIRTLVSFRRILRPTTVFILPGLRHESPCHSCQIVAKPGVKDVSDEDESGVKITLRWV